MRLLSKTSKSDKRRTAVNRWVKYFLFIVNFSLWLASIGVLALGVWSYVETAQFSYKPVKSIYDILLNLPIVVIIIGCCLFITTFCGFLGALRENILLLKVFYISIAVVFLLELAGIILVFVLRQQASNFLSDFFKELFIVRYQDDENAIIDYFQENFYCCGINTFTDWNGNEYFNCTDLNPSALKCAVPYSCCERPDKLTPGVPNVFCGVGALKENSTTADAVYQEGCLHTVIQYAEDNLPIIGGVVLSIVVPQVIGIVLGRLLDTQIKTQRKRNLMTTRCTRDRVAKQDNDARVCLIASRDKT